VRNFVIGPVWWHKLSVRLAYLPLDFVLVHDQQPEPSPVPAGVRVVQVPHGLYEISGPAVSAAEIRRSWGVKDGQKVFLAFGYVRDGKNLDMAVRALAGVSEAFLVMAGSVASTKDKPFAYYRELATKLGVLDRCHFAEGFVADDELGKYFASADFVLLTYAATFHSQSGVLNIAARARKPVLASASPSPLIESVRIFQLGITVEPDSAAAVVNGMKQLLSAPPSPRWEEYEAAASWAVNARGVLEAAGLEPKAEKLKS
jgi:glycosyltransferase involved in cell wall biosynthesis